MVFMREGVSLRLFHTSEELFKTAAQDFCERAMDAVRTKGVFSVVLSGGNTPKSFFDILVQDKYCRENTPWKMIRFFFGDERYVASSDERNNYHCANEHLFSKVPISLEHIFRISTDFKNPESAAKDYEKTLRKAFHIHNDALPVFDLVYLGLGEDAHTASLMPYSAALEDGGRSVACVLRPESNELRITMTPRAINCGENIIFLVTGAEKAKAVCAVLEGPSDPQRLPAQLIHSVKGKTIWFLDKAASEKLRISKEPIS
jgi:6-phosphogluconolactonase